MQVAENVQTNWQERCCFIMTMTESKEHAQTRREFKNYSENFFNILLTAGLGP
jgi:hypothetical protein